MSRPAGRAGAAALPSPLAKAIDEFLRYIDLTLNLSPRTVISYRSDLALFETFLRETWDPGRSLAYNQMTATLPEFRRRGLALAAKLAAVRWAAANGFERILTENDEANAGMLAINRRLGYRPLYDQTKWVLEWEGPPGERR